MTVLWRRFPLRWKLGRPEEEAEEEEEGAGPEPEPELGARRSDSNCVSMCIWCFVVTDLVVVTCCSNNYRVQHGLVD